VEEIMAITLGGKKGLLAEMNVVPLIDILLVLLIIFMVITPTTPLGLAVETPQADQGPPPPRPEDAIVVWITGDGQLRINQEETDWAQLGPRLEEVFKTRAQKVAFVWSDSQIQFQEIARVIEIVRNAGVDRVGLLPASFAKN
jgi:biopolymer transport protein ExbD